MVYSEQISIMEFCMRNFIIKLTLLMTLAALFAGAASAQEGLQTAFAKRANFRDGPSPEWVIVGTYNAGTPIVLDGQAYEGTWVRGIVPDGTVGWVIVTALGMTQFEATAQLPTVWVDDPFVLAPPAGGGGVTAAVAEPTAEVTVLPEATEEAKGFAPVGEVASVGSLPESAFDVLPGEFIHDTNGMPFHPWGNDDGRINLGEFFGGLALYCVDGNGTPSDSYRGGGMQVLGTDGSLLLYVPSGTILAGWQQMQSSGQDVQIGAGAGVSLTVTAPGAFRADAVEPNGKPVSFSFPGCRLVPKATSDNCPPSWDRDSFGNCVHRNLY
jgi:hypothetical protein